MYYIVEILSCVFAKFGTLHMRHVPVATNFARFSSLMRTTCQPWHAVLSKGWRTSGVAWGWCITLFSCGFNVFMIAIKIMEIVRHPFLYFELYLYSAYAAHYVNFTCVRKSSAIMSKHFVTQISVVVLRV